MVLSLPDGNDGAAPARQPAPNGEELWKMYTDLLQVKNKLEKSCMEKEELLHLAQQALAEEQAKRETAEKEKQLFEEKYTQLQRRVEALETVFQESMAQMRKEREREHLRKQNEKFQRLEAQIKTMSGNKLKIDYTSKTTENSYREDTSEPSCLCLICELLRQLISLVAKLFSCI
ncbi:guanylate-binding protein 7-like [Hyaena hyaena]|uniref:guanylate-binding protein 7-like n=1 Tax=Hyaena hyaena TaxID=95912 RepID=UPI001922EBEF|nr:guanylate-binding protein 7-like [Hyaena hyaena]